ncbi:efflux RND transporter periplasmic adaptor subunit [Novosphingobium sp. 1949]|uniref:Efflux RND transporter periplasmic adaptor subunit n=1 Tax=Novosphingobium organovorum TaxID=2930092 RepID=A0ABT0BDK6_9SPHN|nr:efflux RND transporter periplasmic adaptor subunit [Novosphingobium organovorum]MCJ2182928.1 efflux RND transporter periplasmic adaptor subunit [Novosphingobium organovorum]
MNDRSRLYTGVAAGLLAAAGIGFSAARLTQPVPAVPEEDAASEAVPSDSLALSTKTIARSQITVAPAAAGALDAAVSAPATVEATPDAEARLTARAPGTVSRIFKRIGDPVRAGETLALVESRDASQIAAERSAASARVTLAHQQAERERALLAQGVSPRADYEAAQANLAVAQAEARSASAAAGAVNLANDGRSIAIVSPVAGRITAAPASLGQYVAPETELFRVADPARLQITASLPAREAARVRAGDRVELTIGDGETIEGRVRSSTGVVDATTRGATLVIDPQGAGSRLAPGQLVQARIFASTAAAKSGAMVPEDAVQTLGDRTVVFVRTKTGFKARDVQIAARSGGLVSITSGLAAGTPIATTNAFLIKAEIEKDSAE